MNDIWTSCLFRWTPPRRQHSSWPAGSSMRAWTFWTWNVCEYLRFWPLKVHQHEAGACQSSLHKDCTPCSTYSISGTWLEPQRFHCLDLEAAAVCTMESPWLPACRLDLVVNLCNLKNILHQNMIYEEQMNCKWMVYTVYMNNIWMIYSFYTTNIWIVCTCYMNNIWMIYPFYMTCIWFIYRWYISGKWNYEGYNRMNEIMNYTSSTSTSRLCTRMDPQILRSRSTVNPVRPTRTCPTDPTTRDTSFVAGSRPKCTGCWRTPATLTSGSRNALRSTATCATEATHPRLSTPRFAQSTGTSEAKCWSQRNVWQTIGSSLSTVAASSRTETRRGVQSCGWRWTSRSRSYGSKAGGATSSPHTPSSRSGARSRWDTPCLGDVIAISMGLPRWPQNREYSRSLLWPQRCWTNKSHAGPRSNSLREFESIHIIGGQRSHWQAADRFGPWKIRVTSWC